MANVPIDRQIAAVRTALAAILDSGGEAPELNAALATMEWVAAHREAVIVAAQEVRRLEGTAAVRAVVAGFPGAIITDIRGRGNS